MLFKQGGVSLNPDDYFKAYLSHSDINLVTNTIITSLVKDLGHEHLNEWRTSPIIKLITYRQLQHKSTPNLKPNSDNNLLKNICRMRRPH